MTFQTRMQLHTRESKSMPEPGPLPRFRAGKAAPRAILKQESSRDKLSVGMTWHDNGMLFILIVSKQSKQKKDLDAFVHIKFFIPGAWSVKQN